MEKHYSRIISFLLAVVMVVGLMPGYVFATETDELPVATAGEEFTVEIVNGGDRYQVSFTPETDGVYIFESFADVDTYGNIYDSEGDYVAHDDDSGTYNNFAVMAALNAGETYILEARYYSSSRTGSFTAKIVQLDATPLTLDTEVQQEAGTTKCYSFIPETEEQYVAYGSGSDVGFEFIGAYNVHWYEYNECWGTRDCSFQAPVGELMYFKVTSGDEAVTVGVTGQHEVESITYNGPAFNCVYNPWSYESYTANVDIVPAHADVRNINWAFEDGSLASIWSNGPDTCKFWSTGVGETSLIVSNGDTEMLRIPVTSEALPALNLDEPVTLTFTGTEYYSFTPEESGAYCFYISETNAYVTFRCAGEDGNGYQYEFGNGCELCLYLEAGVTYYPYLSTSYETTCTFAVTQAVPATSITSTVTEIKGTYISGATLENTQVQVTLAPEHADYTDLQWTIADTSVAEIGMTGSNYCSVCPVGVGSTELIITAGDAELRIPITYDVPGAIVLDTPETVYSEDSSDVKVFQFVPEESGSYTFYISNCDNSAYMWLRDTQGGWLDSAYYDSWNQGSICVSLVAGETYYLYARSNDYYNSATFDVTVIESPVVETITADTTELDMVYLGNVSYSYQVNVEVTPQYADVNSLQWQILDTSVAELEGPYGNYCDVNPVGAGETELVITAESGAELRIPIKVTGPTPISVGDEVTVTGDGWGDQTWFVFVPEETAYYSIYVGECTSSAYIRLSDQYDDWLDSISVNWDSNNDYICTELTAGETYYLRCEPSWNEPSEFTVNLIRSPEINGITAETTSISGVYAEYFGREYCAYISIDPEYAATTGITWTIGDTSVAQIDRYGNNYCYIYPTGAGETTLTASTEGGVSVSIPVVFTEPLTMAPDVVYNGTSQDYNDEILYSFVPEETASYIFTITDCDNSVYFWLRSNLGSYIASGSGYRYGSGTDIVTTLYAGERYYLTVRSYNSNTTNYGVMVYKEPQITEITSSVTSIEGYYAPGVYSEVFVDISYLPENASMSSLSWTIGNIVNPAAGAVAEITGWNNEGVYVSFVSCGIAELQVITTRGDMVSLSIPITVAEPYTLWLNSSSDGYSSGAGDRMMHSFTPDTTGDYTFYISNTDDNVDMFLVDSEGNYLADGYYYYNEGSRDISVTLEAGQTYTLVSESNSDSEARYYVNVIEAPEVESITADTDRIEGIYIVGNSSYYSVNLTLTPDHAAAGSLNYEILDTSVAEIIYTGSGMCELRIVGVGETELVISAENGAECRIPIVATEPEALVPGTTYQVSTGSTVWYSFTPEETGEYMIYSEGTNVDPWVSLYCVGSYGLSDMGYSDDYDNLHFYLNNTLQAGVTYYYQIGFYSGRADYVDVYFGQPGEITSITVNTEDISGYVNPNSEYPLEISTTPKYSDVSSISVESMNEEVVQVKRYGDIFYYSLVGVGTTQIVVTWNDETYEINVEAKTVPALELNVPTDVISQDYTDVQPFTFTPAADGHYTFYLTNVTRGVRYILFDADGDFVAEGSAGSDWGTDLCAELEAGQTYTLQTWSSSDYEAAYTVTVIEAPAVESITVGQEQINAVYISGMYNTAYVWVTVTPAHAAASSLRYEILDTSVAEVEYTESSGCNLCVIGVGETELVITTESGVECRVPVVVTEPEELVPGTTYQLSPGDSYVWYSFTPEETGQYMIYSNNSGECNPAVRLYRASQYGMSTMGSSDDYNDLDFYLNSELQAGVTYYYRIRDYWGEGGTMEVYFGQPGEITSITVNTEDISGYVMPDAATPLDIETTPLYGDLSSVTVESTNEDVVTVAYYNGTYYYTLVGVGTAQILVTWNDEQYTINVEAMTIPALELDVEVIVTTNYMDYAYYTFTPTESGVYSLYAHHSGGFRAHLHIVDEYGNEVAYGYYRSSDNNRDAQGYMEAGKTYYVYTYANTEADSTYTMCITKAKEPTSIECDVTEVEGYADTRGSVELSILPAHANLQEILCVSSDISVVEAYVGSGYLEYYLNSVGTATITVTAGDIEHVIQVTVKAPTVLELGVEEQATSANFDDPVFFQFTPEEDGYYTFYFGTWDTAAWGELYDENDNYCGWIATGGSIERCVELEAGVTYILRTVSDYYGTANYTVGVVQALEVTDMTFDVSEVEGIAGSSGGFRYYTDPAHGNVTEMEVTVADEDIAYASASGGIIYYELLSAGETEIIVTIGDLQWTIPVTVTLPPEMELNVPVSITENSTIFRFIPDETGDYTFFFSNVEGNVAMELYEEEGEWIGTAIWYDYYGVYVDLNCELEAGKTYLVRTYPQTEGTVANLTVIETPVLTGLTSDFDEINLTYIAGIGSGQYVTVSSLPAHADLSELEWTVADESVAMLDFYQNGLCYIMPVGLGETELIASIGDYELRIPVKVTEPEQLPVNTTLTMTEQAQIYTLTPSVTGEYTFTTTGDANPYMIIWEVSEDGELTVILDADDTGDSYNYDITWTLEAGKQYVIGLGNYDDGIAYQLTVTGPAADVLYGDVNKDGNVDNMDATLVLQHAAGWDVELADAVAADVNCDGSIDNMDATLILQYAAGWDVTLGPSN